MKKDLVLAVFGALLGTGLGYAVSSFTKDSVLSWVLIAVIVLSSVVSLAFLGPLRQVLRSAGSTKLQGKWMQTWSYSKNGVVVEIEEELKVQQFGCHLRGQSRSIRVAGPYPFNSASAVFEGEVPEPGVIQGNWYNVDDGRNYRGVFTGVVSASGREVQLIWVGTENNGIRHGRAKWVRL